MKNFLQKSIILLLFFIHIIGCTPDQQQSRLTVAASIAPIADFTKIVGGGFMDVFLVVEAGTNPHVFELTPDLMRKISRSRVLVINGAGMEFWAQRVSDTLPDSHLKIIDTSQGVEILQEMESEHDIQDIHGHSGGNPHIWLNPLNAVKQVDTICQALSEIDTAHAANYRQNADRYIEQLILLDKQIQTEIATWKNKEFVCFHPAWAYFANHFGLVQAAVIEKSPGVEAGPQEIMELMQIIKRIGARAVFAEAQFPEKLSKMIANDSHIQVIPLDPLGTALTNFNYIDMMKYNVEQMAKALKN